MIAAFLAEGYAALRDAAGTAGRRAAQGLDRAEFVNGMLVGGAVTVASIVAPELSGMSAIMDRAMGDEPSNLMLSWPILPVLMASIAVMTALMIWKGPYLGGALARGFGGQSSLMASAVWLYVATAATTVISGAIMVFDIIGGLAAELLPQSFGLVSLAVSVFGLIGSLAITAVLARQLLGLTGVARSLGFATVWLAGLLALGFAIAAPLYALLGGTSS